MNDLPSYPSIHDTMLTFVARKNRLVEKNSRRMYLRALEYFERVLIDQKIDTQAPYPADINFREAVNLFLDQTGTKAPATERLYTTVVSGYLRYLAAEEICEINLAKMQSLIKDRIRRLNNTLPGIPRDNLDKLISYAQSLKSKPEDKEVQHLINLRDRALILTLSDTGLRIHEACELVRGQIDYHSGRAVVHGKGNKDAVVRFSPRALDCIRDYLRERTAVIDGKAGKSLGSLPIFIRHDLAASAIEAISTKTGRAIIKARVIEVLGEEEKFTISPHTFRHYFVTVILAATQNLKIAQELARHKSVATTQRYTHLVNAELDAGYNKGFGDKTAK